ncbi:MAG: hypothetical protein EOO68_40765 [Moraxellaceae bacterium]|nr:MAG: hypothetical protein EOO68_40765 [Moraxellaceae bacterium]
MRGLYKEALKNVGGEALVRQIFQKKTDDCMDAGGRATQEQLPSLHVVNEHFFGKFNDARASEVIFQSFRNYFLEFIKFMPLNNK